MTEYRYNDADGDRISVQPRHDGPFEFNSDAAPDEIHIAAPDGVFIPRKELPAFLLACLTASGVKPTDSGDPLSVAAFLVTEAVEEAKDDAELDAEALRLFTAATSSKWEDFPNPDVRATWRRAAVAARRIHSPKESK